MLPITCPPRVSTPVHQSPTVIDESSRTSPSRRRFTPSTSMLWFKGRSLLYRQRYMCASFSMIGCEFIQTSRPNCLDLEKDFPIMSSSYLPVLTPSSRPSPVHSRWPFAANHDRRIHRELAMVFGRGFCGTADHSSTSHGPRTNSS
jgi:hypothetical protein